MSLFVYILPPSFCLKASTSSRERYDYAGLISCFNFSEAVAGVVGRADILAAVFFLLALLAFSKHLQIRDKRPSVTSAFANKTNHPNDYECDRNGNFAAASKKLAVYGKGQQSLLSSSSTFLVLEPYLLLTVIFAACAMFSKEQGITVLGNHLYIFLGLKS